MSTRKIWAVFLCIGMIMWGFLNFAQSIQISTKNKKAINLYELAMKSYDRYDFATAEESLQKAIKLDGNFIEAHIFLTQVYQASNRIDKAIEASQRAIAVNPDYFPGIHLNLGNMLFGLGRYEAAMENFKKYLSYPNIRREPKETAELRLLSCLFALQAIANPVPFNLINLGGDVNSNLDEYWPSLSANENTLVITVKKPLESPDEQTMQRFQEDFYITQRNADGDWDPVKNIGAPINTPYFNEGAQSLTADGQTMYYTICRGFCNLYVTDRNEQGHWGRPRPLPNPVNLPNSSEKQPSISPDGNTLYFVSSRAGGLGEFDIWRTHRVGKNEWTKPENLGDSINTRFNEQSPFIHFDNQTLYFSSNGHVGLGGLDIYMARMVNDSTWSRPTNLGYPINTHGDEDGLIVNAKGTMAYYSSDVNPEMGRDIYRFEIPQQIRPTPTSYITGNIIDSKTGWPVEAKVQLVDVSEGRAIMNVDALRNGSFFMPIPTNRAYAFFASAPGYLFHSEHFDLVGVHSADSPFRKDVELNPIRVGQTMVMRNVFFETNSYELKSESLAELKMVLELLSLNPAMIIEVGGHTDNVGTNSHNQSLSENRAKSVANFFTSKGVDSKRIAWKGYGQTKPIGDNATEEGRAKNRRTEIKVLGM